MQYFNVFVRDEYSTGYLEQDARNKAIEETTFSHEIAIIVDALRPTVPVYVAYMGKVYHVGEFAESRPYRGESDAD